ncbi:dihydroneopterin aldolase [Vulcanococcus sp.]|uniref:dihydroneopterin aldolase n=1 Tax=Vulcanococcus sp. TaxID=2856995 RepID=UPI003F6965E0
MSAPLDCVVVRGLRLWAHVGVLEHERQMGQWFELDFSLGCNLSAAAAADGLEQSLDYSLAIQALQLDASRVRCLTLEHWSDKIFEVLEDLYGSVPIWLELRKCQAPVPGFYGIVAVQRSRRWPS